MGHSAPPGLGGRLALWRAAVLAMTPSHDCCSMTALTPAAFAAASSPDHLTVAPDRRIVLYHTTLRDGAQTQGVDFSVVDKQVIATELDRLGVDYIEGGWPGANPTDDAFFASPPRLRHAALTAFGMTRRPGRSAANDPGLGAVLQAGTAAVCLVGKASDLAAELALGVTPEENLDLIGDFVAEAVRRGRDVLFDAEHFFDDYQRTPDYALSCLRRRAAGGCRLAGAVRYQWRHPARADLGHCRRGGGGPPGGADRHSYP